MIGGPQIAKTFQLQKFVQIILFKISDNDQDLTVVFSSLFAFISAMVGELRPSISTPALLNSSTILLRCLRVDSNIAVKEVVNRYGDAD